MPATAPLTVCRIPWSAHLAVLFAGAVRLPETVQAMRCGTHFISQGDIQAEVLLYCGDPLQATQSLAYLAGACLDQRVRQGYGYNE